MRLKLPRVVCVFGLLLPGVIGGYEERLSGRWIMGVDGEGEASAIDLNVDGAVISVGEGDKCTIGTWFLVRTKHCRTDRMYDILAIQVEKGGFRGRVWGLGGMGVTQVTHGALIDLKLGTRRATLTRDLTN